jgi:hypothetical protein
LTAAQRALALLFKKLNFRKGWFNQNKRQPGLYRKKQVPANTGGRVDQQRSVRTTREPGCGRRLCAAAKWGEQAKAANLIFPHCRISDGSGILF